VAGCPYNPDEAYPPTLTLPLSFDPEALEGEGGGFREGVK